MAVADADDLAAPRTTDCRRLCAGVVANADRATAQFERLACGRAVALGIQGQMDGRPQARANRRAAS